MLWLLLTLGFIVLILLIFRFVYPELIYSIREAAVDVEINRAFLESEIDGSKSSARLNRAQIKHIRFEIRPPNETYIRYRISDIKKLYHLLSPRKKNVPGISDEQRKPQLCLIELANLISHYGKIIIPDQHLEYPLCVSEEILTLIANDINFKKKKDFVKKEDVKDWYVRNPISVEQSIEMLSAALYALSYRQESQQTKID